MLRTTPVLRVGDQSDIRSRSSIPAHARPHWLQLDRGTVVELRHLQISRRLQHVLSGWDILHHTCQMGCSEEHSRLVLLGIEPVASVDSISILLNARLNAHNEPQPSIHQTYAPSVPPPPNLLATLTTPPRLPPPFPLSNSTGNPLQIQRAQPPHEGKLHDVAVDEQKLCPSRTLRPRNGLHGGIAGGLVRGEEDVFEGAELFIH